MSLHVVGCTSCRHYTEANPIRVIVAGGDGSVMWAMSEVIGHGIDITRVAFGVVPFGTGNDFARSFGWGSSSDSGDVAKNGLHGLKKMIRSWLEASVCDFDLWEVDLHVDPESGTIQQVKSKVKRVLTDGGNSANLTRLTKPMCNYFSVGIESRIGLGFDRNRKHSAFMNKLMYGWEGLKKSITSTPRVSEIVESVNADDRVILSMTNEPPQVKGNPVSLIFINIDSFASGCDLWANAKRTAIQNLSEEEKKNLKNLPQSVGDGKLEVLTYNSLVGLSSEQLPGFKGNGRRVAQDSGPFEVRFRPDLENKRCYMQIDGEFYAVHKPVSVRIRHQHTVKVLRR